MRVAVHILLLPIGIEITIGIVNIGILLVLCKVRASRFFDNLFNSIIRVMMFIVLIKFLILLLGLTDIIVLHHLFEPHCLCGLNLVHLLLQL